MMTATSTDHAATARVDAIAFVASLLPARFLAERGAALGVREIVVSVPVHERSYAYVARRLPDARVSRLRGSRIVAAADLALRLIAARLRGRQVVFFHEACWPEFDILVNVIRPRGAFFPQITMAGLVPTDARDWFDSARAAIRHARIALRPLLAWFEIYKFRRHSGDAGYDFLLRARHYPPSIQVFPVPTGEGADSPDVDAGLRVLFVTGTDSVPEDYLRGVYAGLIRDAQESGYRVYIKDHPIYRLNVPCEACEVIDPAMPIELLDEAFTFVVGLGSTGVASVRGRRLSIVNALQHMPEDVKRLRVEYLVSLPHGGGIEFVEQLSGVREAFRLHASERMTAS